jgi:hypothetical protein
LIKIIAVNKKINEFRDWMDARRLKSSDVCYALHVSEQTIHQWRSSGVPARRVPHVEAFMRDWVETAIPAAEPFSQSVAEYFSPGSSIVLTPGEDRFDRWTAAFKSSPCKTFKEWAETGLDLLATQELGAGQKAPAVGNKTA